MHPLLASFLAFCSISLSILIIEIVRFEPLYTTVTESVDLDISKVDGYKTFWYPLTLEIPEYNMTARDIECLAKNIFFEASTEDLLGKYAVAQVTLNRLKTGHWGKDICSVVYSAHQFSWTRDSRKRNARPGRAPLQGLNWDCSLEVARDVAEGRRMSTLATALWYHADYVKPNWRDSQNEIKHLGKHVFYSRARGSNLTME